MRLIDADMLIEEIEKIALEVEQQTQGRRNGKTLAQGILFGLGAMRKTVLEQPTAYDPDKVVEQLEEKTELAYRRYMDCPSYSPCFERYRTQYAERKMCLEIVKGGGIDGN